MKKNKLTIIQKEGIVINKQDYLVTSKLGISINAEIDTDGMEPEEVKKIRWICSTFNGKPEGLTFHPAMHGNKIHFKVSNASAGIGLIWLEPVLPEQEPTYIPPNGYFVNCTRKKKITKIEWREYQKDNLGEIITDEKGLQIAKGQLTLKDKTQTITFLIQQVVKRKELTIKGKAIINRTDFGITYNSPSYFENLGDQAIADEMELTFELFFIKE